jgi:signal peptidase I
MKPKRRLFIIVMVAAFVGFYLVVKVTGMLERFSIPTPSSKPAMQIGDHIWVSSLVKPKRYDFIVYKHFDSMTQKKEFRVFRLCGIPGDTVEIRNGDLYLNNRNTSGLFDLCLAYNIAGNDGMKVNELLKLEEGDFTFFNESKSEVILSKDQVDEVKKLHIALERRIVPKEETNEYISRLYGKSWNIDHFGPIVIPRDRYFVLGDNRHRAQDSRYDGLVPISDFYGTVISK